ncbi:MAG: hypothetical protein HUJ77_04065 [Clostridium sp.]|uniref:hypothetical protein n=1 Tax=Clostridium sp. TaxID=1506 RepID=UPI0025B98211|nr:hypothetical protein [Clostridium sp.]MCF0147555.1 hypothetical protein [Clostridium sp.]
MFEIYLNQNIPTTSKTISSNSYDPKNNYKNNKSLRFHNFKGRDCDYDALESKNCKYEF